MPAVAAKPATQKRQQVRRPKPTSPLASQRPPRVNPRNLLDSNSFSGMG